MEMSDHYRVYIYTFFGVYVPYITSLMILVRISKPKQMAYTGKWMPASFLAKTSCKYKMIGLTTVRREN